MHGADVDALGNALGALEIDDEENVPNCGGAPTDLPSHVEVESFLDDDKPSMIVKKPDNLDEEEIAGDALTASVLGVGDGFNAVGNYGAPLGPEKPLRMGNFVNYSDSSLIVEEHSDFEEDIVGDALSASVLGDNDRYNAPGNWSAPSGPEKPLRMDKFVNGNQLLVIVEGHSGSGFEEDIVGDALSASVLGDDDGYNALVKLSAPVEEDGVDALDGRNLAVNDLGLALSEIEAPVLAKRSPNVRKLRNGEVQSFEHNTAQYRAYSESRQWLKDVDEIDIHERKHDDMPTDNDSEANVQEFDLNDSEAQLFEQSPVIAASVAGVRSAYNANSEKGVFQISEARRSKLCREDNFRDDERENGARKIDLDGQNYYHSDEHEQISPPPVVAGGRSRENADHQEIDRLEQSEDGSAHTGRWLPEMFGSVSNWILTKLKWNSSNDESEGREQPVDAQKGGALVGDHDPALERHDEIEEDPQGPNHAPPSRSPRQNRDRGSDNQNRDGVAQMNALLDVQALGEEKIPLDIVRELSGLDYDENSLPAVVPSTEELADLIRYGPKGEVHHDNQKEPFRRGVYEPLASRNEARNGFPNLKMPSSMESAEIVFSSSGSAYKGERLPAVVAQTDELSSAVLQLQGNLFLHSDNNEDLQELGAEDHQQNDVFERKHDDPPVPVPPNVEEPVPAVVASAEELQLGDLAAQVNGSECRPPLRQSKLRPHVRKVSLVEEIDDVPKVIIIDHEQPGRDNPDVNEHAHNGPGIMNIQESLDHEEPGAVAYHMNVEHGKHLAVEHKNFDNAEQPGAAPPSFNEEIKIEEPSVVHAEIDDDSVQPGAEEPEGQADEHDEASHVNDEVRSL